MSVQTNARALALGLAKAAVAVTLLATAACGNLNTSGNSASTGIIGGTNAAGTEDFAKSIVSLYNVDQKSLCTASILSDSIAVTAAHCVSGDASSLRVIFGIDLAGTNRSVQQVLSYEANPLYATNSENDLNTGDIAIVHFAGGLPTGYQAASLLGDTTILQTGVDVLLAGYGISDGVASTGAGVLRSVETLIQDAAFSQSEILIDQRNGKGACHGDSGGPAYVKVGGAWMLWGVTNRGVNDPGNTCSVSAAYTNILFYKDWVTSTSAKLVNPDQATAGNDVSGTDSNTTTKRSHRRKPRPAPFFDAAI